MAFKLKQFCILLCVMLLPAVCYTDDTYIAAKATYYASFDFTRTPTGACGYGEYGATVNYGQVCGVSQLYKDGSGCGACYQVRCKHPDYCSEEGTSVVVTDHNAAGHNTEFILSLHAYAKLAKPNKAKELFAAGIVEIEYRRIPCHYPGANLVLKVHEQSWFPHYLAIVILYQGGLYDITAVEVWEESSHEWKPMCRSYGAVWAISNPPKGALAIRFQVSGSAGAKWVQPSKVIPSEWKAGIIVDTAFQLS